MPFFPAHTLNSNRGVAKSPRSKFKYLYYFFRAVPSLGPKYHFYPVKQPHKNCKYFPKFFCASEIFRPRTLFRIINCMSTLYVYACSYGLLGTTQGPFANQWNPNAGWPRMLADSLGMQLVNRSLADTNNDQIIARYAQDRELHMPDDIVIIQWTHLHSASRVHAPYTIFPHDMKDPVTHTYYEYIYDELHALAKVVTATYWISSVTPTRTMFTTIDDVTRWRMCDERTYTTIEQLSNWYPTPCTVLTPDTRFACLHPNQQGHALIARYYENLIRTQ